MKKYSDEAVKAAVQQAVSFNDALRILTGSTSGSSYVHLKKRITSMGIDVSHFTPFKRGSANLVTGKLDPKNILVLKDIDKRVKTYLLRRALLEIGRVEECAIPECRLSEWLGKTLTLQIHHVDGNWKNNTPENLVFLCPNCHTQTDTYGYRGVDKNQPEMVEYA